MPVLLNRSLTVAARIVLLTLAFSPGLRAQFTSGGTGALGDFLNPGQITFGALTCNYDWLRIDLVQGKAFARPRRNSANNQECAGVPPQPTVEVPLADIFSIPPANPIQEFSSGVLEVVNFTLRQTTTPGADNSCCGNVFLEFVPNPNNTPIIIRATGNVSINGGQFLSVEGQPGRDQNGLLRGLGGVGGPGGYRGGDGGNGGLNLSPGAPGLGPGGGPGGAGNADCAGPSDVTTAATFLTTGVTVAGVAVPVGNDVLTLLRGGSGGGGEGGCATRAGAGGGGGGGALLVAATNTITVSGTIRAYGGAGAPNNGGGGGGSGGVIRLVATNIGGGGALNAGGGGGSVQPGAAGMIRLEAISITYSGSLTGNVTAAAVPGTIIVPSDPRLFIRYKKITDANNAANSVTISAALQAPAGQTGGLNPPAVTMPNPAGVPPTSVTVDFEAGPNPGFPVGKTITLVVTPIDPAGGPRAIFTSGAAVCPAPPDPCTASATGVTLPPGVGSLSAFAVIKLSESGVLSRTFPVAYLGEPIDSVRVESDSKGTRYVLIAKSGKEFPYKLGGGR